MAVVTGLNVPGKRIAQLQKTRMPRRNAIALGIVAALTTWLGVDSSAWAGGRKDAGGPVIIPQAKMGDPLPGLTAAELARFQIGKQQFSHVLTGSEGLGPIFNKTSCGNCHSNPTGGPGAQTVTRFGHIENGVFDPLADLGGSLLQVSGISETCVEFIPVEANHQILRVTNGALAFGLVEAIPDAAIAYYEAYPPSPAVSGRVHWVEAFEDPPCSPEPCNQPLHAGRFGWKAQVATVLTFSADAALNEMGLTNRFVTQENDPNGINPPNLGDPDFCDTVADPEDNVALGNGTDKEFIDVVTDFQRFLAPPPQTPKSGMTGETIFNNIGCNQCHITSFTTANDPGLEDAIRNKTLKPYSDWLLHDMGDYTTALGDGIVQGDASGNETKTPPLWGLRRRDPMLHDGRSAGDTFANRIDDVVFWHNKPGSEAQAAGAAYFALTQAERDQVVAFLNSLGRAEFDMDGDEDIDLSDFILFHGCFGPGPYNADAPCAVSDIDQDGDVDLGDFDSFMISYFGPMGDCNLNGIVDLRDILTGVATDNNNNGIPDSCEPTCLSDTNGTHGTDVDDLLAIITQWGPCSPSPAPCSADINVDRVVNIDDLMTVLVFWGPCP